MPDTMGPSDNFDGADRARKQFSSEQFMYCNFFLNIILLIVKSMDDTNYLQYGQIYLFQHISDILGDIGLPF